MNTPPAFLLLLGLLVTLHSWAQEGKIVRQTLVHYPDSLRAARIKQLPRFQQVFDQTETLAITYLSGGLRIQGFLFQKGGFTR